MIGEHDASSPATAEKLSDLDHRIGRILQLLEGDGADAPGLLARLALIERIMFGKEQQDGLVYKVGVLWRMSTWVLCTMSAAAGFMLREVVKLVWKV